MLERTCGTGFQGVAPVSNRCPQVANLCHKITGRLVHVAALTVVLATGVAYAGDPSDIWRDAPAGMTLWSAVTGRESAASADELLARGRQLYGIRCAICHGMSGAGDGPASLFMETQPRDFTRLTFKFRKSSRGFPSDLDLFRSITAGFPAYGMPSFRYLSDEDRWSLVHYVKVLAREGWISEFREQEGSDFDAQEADEIVAERMKPGKPVTVGRPPPAAAESLARGKVLYEQSCLSCHGTTGRADGPSAPDMKDDWGQPIKSHDFTLGRAFRKAGWRHEDLVRVLVTGLPGTPMPSYVELLADPNNLSEFWDLARYVEQLGKAPSQSR